MIQIFYDPTNNIFYDKWGQIIYDICGLIRSSHLRLYRYDPGFSIFPLVDERDIWCEIIEIDSPMSFDDFEAGSSIDFDDFDIGPQFDEELEQARIRWGIGSGIYG